MSDQGIAAGSRKYFRLLVALVALLVLPAITEGLPYAGLVFGLASATMLVVAIWDVARVHRRVILVLFLLGIPAVAGSLAVGLWAGMPRWGAQAVDVAVILFLLLVIFEVGTDVLSFSKVTADTLRGACCFYLLLGLMWGSVYDLVELGEPGSFSLSSAPAAVAAAAPDESAEERKRVLHQQDLDYFSFVTLTTLGFGDITPVTRRARSLVMAEVLMGQLFLAVIIAGLVGSLAAGRRRSR